MSDEKTKNTILNDKEKALLMDHDYDGIQEFDYPLPDWWVWTFVGGIVFAVFYIFYYQFAGGLSLRDEYKRDMKKIEEIRMASAVKADNFNIDEYNAWVAADDGTKAREVFEENCVSCHEAGGKGDIGPNLTDAFWINVKSTDPASIYNVVNKGVEENGMPAWGETISKEELFAAVSFVMSIKNTNVAGGKEPQGNKIE